MINRELFDKILETLGVEEGEIFNIEGNNYDYRIKRKEGLQYLLEDQNIWENIESYLGDLLFGEYVIIKKPFEPKADENYYVPSITGNEVYHGYVWTYKNLDFYHKRNNLICRTPQEALEKRDKILESLRGEEEESND